VAAKRDDELWLDDQYLPVQVWSASFDFQGFGLTISGRPALHDVCNEDLFSRKADL